MQNTEEPLKILTGIHKRGIRLSLDDFGTGYSALSYLKQFPLQVLKIDRSFISDLLQKDSNRTLVETIIAMANSLNLDLVAEGVETQEQLKFLRDRGVRIVQGFMFSQAIPGEKFFSLFLKH